VWTLKPLLIHIGYHKTGTTWLQNRLFNNETLGFYSPWGSQSHLAIEHFVICNPFRFDPSAASAAFKPGIDEAHRKGCAPVITHEDLCGYPVYGRYYGKETLERLHAAFPKAKIVVGIREQTASIVSHYRQYIRQGGHRTITDFFGDPGKTGFAPICRPDHFEYNLIISHCMKLFGKEDVLVLPLEMLRENPELYLNSIYQFSDLDTEGMPEMTLSNVGWGGFTLTVSRSFNSFNFGEADWSKTRQSLSFRVASKTLQFIDRLTPRFIHKRFERGIACRAEDLCGDYYAKSNREVAEITGLPLRELGYLV
jgi:hypothetical protein